MVEFQRNCVGSLILRRVERRSLRCALRRQIDATIWTVGADSRGEANGAVVVLNLALATVAQSTQAFYRLADEKREIILVACSKCDWRAAFSRDDLIASHSNA